MTRRVLVGIAATAVLAIAAIGIWAVVIRTSADTLASNQSPADAARDQIVPALALLPPRTRIRQVDELFGPTRVDTAEGTWIISEPNAEAINLINGCELGHPAGVEGRDRICVFEYAEILLLDSAGQIVRAYPFPIVPPRSLVATDDALYCIRQGDGGLPDSMLCRIDLDNLEATVRVFPSDLDSAFQPSMDRWMPTTWTVDEPAGLVLWEHIEAADGSITISGWSGTATVDPITLALVNVERSRN